MAGELPSEVGQDLAEGRARRRVLMPAAGDDVAQPGGTGDGDGVAVLRVGGGGVREEREWGAGREDEEGRTKERVRASGGRSQLSRRRNDPLLPCIEPRLLAETRFCCTKWDGRVDVSEILPGWTS